MRPAGCISRPSPSFRGRHGYVPPSRKLRGEVKEQQVKELTK
ncbi:TPA: hypothetical protein ACX6R0_000329 [Photobacterium damselae]|nr:hypothetical protein [Photobacterium damselae]